MPGPSKFDTSFLEFAWWTSDKSSIIKLVVPAAQYKIGSGDESFCFLRMFGSDYIPLHRSGFRLCQASSIIIGSNQKPPITSFRRAVKLDAKPGLRAELYSWNFYLGTTGNPSVAEARGAVGVSSRKPSAGIELHVFSTQVLNLGLNNDSIFDTGTRLPSAASYIANSTA